MLATSMDSAWGSGHARAALISAPPTDDAPAPRGADVVLAFAQAAAQPVTAAPAPSGGSWAATPITPMRPGGLWIEPVVSALLDPDPPLQPSNPQTPLAATEPLGEGTTTATVPPDAHAVPAPFDPSLSSPGTAGTPFKRGTQPSEKPGARSAAPLPNQFQFPNTIHAITPAQPRGSADPASPNPDSSFDPPAEAANPSPDATPADAPRGLAPVLDRGGDPGPTGTGPQFSGPAQLPSLNDTGRVLERVATGTPGPGENPFNAPRFEVVALPADLLVAAVVPEPASLLLFAIASFSLAGLGRARRQ
jgi:hypothetical protein